MNYVKPFKLYKRDLSGNVPDVLILETDNEKVAANEWHRLSWKHVDEAQTQFYIERPE